MAVAKELTSIPEFGDTDNGEVFGKEKKALKNQKKALLMIAGAAVQKLQKALGDEQEILMNLADMVIQCYVAESTILRAEKIIKIQGGEEGSIYEAMAMVYLHYANVKVSEAGREAIYAFAEGDELRMMLMGLKRFTKIDAYNLKEARRKIADYLLDKNDFSF